MCDLVMSVATRVYYETLRLDGILARSEDSHTRLTKKVEGIFANAGFQTDRGVEIQIPVGDGIQEFELDVCALYDNALIVIECKSGGALKFKDLILQWTAKREKLSKGPVT